MIKENFYYLQSHFNFFQWIGEQKDWLTVLLSFAAIVLSGLSIWYQMTVNVKEQKRQEMIERRSQAVNVTAWLTEDTQENRNVIISNTNTTPIYDVFIFFVSNRSQGTISDLKMYDACQYIDVLPPGQLYTYVRPNNGSGGQHIVPQLLFKDSTGITWFRNLKGNLEEIDELFSVLSDYDFYGPYSQYSSMSYR